MVVLVGFEPEEESPIIFLRLRKAARKHGLRVVSIAPFASRGSDKLGARVIPTAPGAEAAALDALATRRCSRNPARSSWSANGWPPAAGALSAAARLAERTGARLAWVPRRAGDRGALDAGCLPEPAARRTAGRGCGCARNSSRRHGTSTIFPPQPGRDTAAILAAAADGDLDALLVGGVDPTDLPDPHAALAAIEAAGFVVSLELRESRGHRAAPTSCSRSRPSRRRPAPSSTGRAGSGPSSPRCRRNAFSDLRVLQTLADELGVDLGFRTAEQAARRDRGARHAGTAPRRRPGRPGPRDAAARHGRGGAGGLADVVGRRPVTGR